MDLLALLAVIDLLLQLVKTTDLLKLKKASKRLGLEDLFLELFLVGVRGGGDGKGAIGDRAAASEAAVVLEIGEEAQRRKPRRFLVVNFGKGTGRERLAYDS